MEVYGSKYESFSLFNDSMSSLMALSNPDYDDPLVADIHESRVGLEVKWYWIKAHIDVQGNEAPDWLAKTGVGLVVANLHVDLPPRFVKHYLSQ